MQFSELLILLDWFYSEALVLSFLLSGGGEMGEIPGTYTRSITINDGEIVFKNVLFSFTRF